MLAEDRVERYGIVNDQFSDDYQTYFGAFHQAKCGDFILDELTDILLPPRLLVCQVLIVVRLLAGMDFGLSF